VNFNGKNQRKIIVTDIIMLIFQIVAVTLYSTTHIQLFEV